MSKPEDGPSIASVTAETNLHRVDLDQTQREISDVDRSSDLARRCADMLKEGKDFPIIWDTLLKMHPLVAGAPHQRMDGKRALLEVWLVTGQRLVFDGDVREFRLE